MFLFFVVCHVKTYCKCCLVGFQFVCAYHGNDGRCTCDAGSDSGFLSFFHAVWSAGGPCHQTNYDSPILCLVTPECVCLMVCAPCFRKCGQE